MYTLIINNDQAHPISISTAIRSFDPDSTTYAKYYFSGTIEGDYDQTNTNNLAFFALSVITDISVLDAEDQQRMHLTSNGGKIIALTETLDGIANSCYFNIRL